jgi:4-alpha-glucanotransferase
MSLARPDDATSESIRVALARLGIDRFVLSIHQASFPAGEDDVGVGTPHSARGVDFAAYARSLGFDGIALGPGGKTSRSNPSPYDATAFSKSPLSIALGALTGSDEGPWSKLLDPSEIVLARRGVPETGSYADAFDLHRELLERALGRADAKSHGELERRLEAFRLPWLERERAFEEIAAAVGSDDWASWPSEPPRLADAGRRFELEQLLAHEQHQRFRATLRSLGLRLYADLAIGTSHRDRSIYKDRFLRGYVMGAPPSRTNPGGQPWGYAVLDPRGLADGPSRAFVQERAVKLLAEHDGLRIDHPHGWVCPWVYRDGTDDPAAAVRAGARLFESPDLPDHPALSEYARVRPDQLDRSQARHADGWVISLEPAQIERYAVVVDLFVEEARASGADVRDLMIEVLSTCPRPLLSVLERHRLGRFRVTQKASMTDPEDVYRSDRAAPEDWIMVGNHDTPPLALVIDRWREADEAHARARYLAGRLEPDPSQRSELSRQLSSERGALVTAMLADLFLGPARHVLVFWADLFGERRIYNRPGEPHPDNWTLRVPSDFERARALAVARGDAPSIERALALALRARSLDEDGLAERLIEAATKRP